MPDTKHYVAIAGKYDTTYDVVGPFPADQVFSQTHKLCAGCDYRPDEDKFLNITLHPDGRLEIEQTDPYADDGPDDAA